MNSTETKKKIVGIKCQKCGKIQHEDHLRCLKCKNDTFEKIEANGECTLLTYTILNAPPSEFRDKQSYGIAVVEFENGIKALGQIEIRENLKTGMKLKPVYEKICKNLDGIEIYDYVFKIIE